MKKWNPIILIIILVLVTILLYYIVAHQRNRGRVIILLDNHNVSYHHEILESVYFHIDFILKKPLRDTSDVYLYIQPNPSFQAYMSQRYPYLRWCDKNTLPHYNYRIQCSFYPEKTTYSSSPSEFYIAHGSNKKYPYRPNIYYLTPLCKHPQNYFFATHLPFRHDPKISSVSTPIFVVQGDLKRRCMKSVVRLLTFAPPSMPFKIKILSKTQELPLELEPWKDQLIVQCNLDFQDFHREFLTVDGLLFLTDRKKNSAYYSTKLTSSVNYCKAYSLPCLIDTSLQSIYSLANAFVHEDQDDLCDAFHRMLQDWYRREPIQLNIYSPSSTPDFGEECNPIVIQHHLSPVYRIVNIKYSTTDTIMWRTTSISGDIVPNSTTRNLMYPLLYLPTIYQPIRHPGVENRILVILRHKNKKNYPIPSFMDTISCYERWDTIVDKISSYQAVLSTTLNGLICADAYNKPNLWLKEEDEKQSFNVEKAFHNYFKTQKRPDHKISSLNAFHKSLLYHHHTKTLI